MVGEQLCEADVPVLPAKTAVNGAVLSGEMCTQAAFEQRAQSQPHVKQAPAGSFSAQVTLKVDCASSARRRPLVGGLRGQPASKSLWWPPDSRPWPRLTVPVALGHPIGGLAAQARDTPVALPFSAQRRTNCERTRVDKTRIGSWEDMAHGTGRPSLSAH